MTTDALIPCKKTSQEEDEDVRHAMKELLGQIPHTGDGDSLADEEATQEREDFQSALKEDIARFPRIEDEEEEEHCANGIDYIKYRGDTHLDEKKNEVEEECVDFRLTAQQAEIWAATAEQEINLPFSQLPSVHQHQLTPPTQDSVDDGDGDDDGGVAGQVCKEDIDEEIENLTDLQTGMHRPDFCQQHLQSEQRDDILHSQEDFVLPSAVDQLEDKIVTSNGDAVSACLKDEDEEDRSSVALGPLLPCLNQPRVAEQEDVNVGGDGAPVTSTDAEGYTSSIVCGPHVHSCQQLQSEQEEGHDGCPPPLDENNDLPVHGPDVPSCDKEHQSGQHDGGAGLVLSEEGNVSVMHGHHLPSSNQDQESDQKVNSETFDTDNIAADSDAVVSDGDGVGVTAPVMAEDMSGPHLPSFYKEQQNRNDEAVTRELITADRDTDAVNGDNVTAYATAEDNKSMYGTHQEQQSDPKVNHESFDDEIAASHGDNVRAAFKAEDNPPMYGLHLPSFNQSEQEVNIDNGLSSPGIDEDSGISIKILSPDTISTPLSHDDFPALIVDTDLKLPGMESYQQPQHFGQMEAHHSQDTDDDISEPVMNEEGVNTRMIFGPYPSLLYQRPQSEQTDQAVDEPWGGNDDMFGQVIEDNYYKEMNQFSEQIAANISIVVDEPNEQTAAKDSTESPKMKERGSVDKKEGTQAEEKKEEDKEKTEISIMEATMDNNEWITDGNYQVLPWMSFSLPSFAQDHPKTDQLTTEERQHNSTTATTLTDTAIDAVPVDTTTAPGEAEETAVPLTDENTETNKKVAAVPPMPQNVNVSFCVHYLTHSPSQTVAVTGKQQELGSWKGFVPLERAKDGFWASVIGLPAESQVEWKFVLVEEGVICRWEECDNRVLDTGYGDDLHVHEWWGVL
ncbi:uncharacterized protein stbd1 [Polymixia lowei]